jgi:hypothetical protein
MTKAELQSAVAAAAQTDKKTAGVFLDTLSAIAYKATKLGRGASVIPLSLIALEMRRDSKLTILYGSA